MLVEVVGQGLGTVAIHIEDAQLAHTFTEQRMGDCRTGTAGAHLYYTCARHISQAAAKAFGKAQAVGVVADALAVLEHHGVHRADATCLR
ncbi:hypothetical protein D3C76_1275890 [compost metagenome]